MATVGGVRRVQSTSEVGRSTVVAEFEWGTAMDFATLEMRERLDNLRDVLPEGARVPQIFKFDPSLAPILEFSVSGEADPAALRREVEEVIRPRLERIPGVAAVNVTGGLEEEIRIAVHPARLHAAGLALADLRQALAAASLNLPAGSLVQGDREWLLRTLGEFRSLEDIRRALVALTPRGAVQVRDVATVERIWKDAGSITRLDGRPSVSVSIQKESGANSVRISRAVHAELQRLSDSSGGRWRFDVVWDEARFIRSSIRTVLESGTLGAACAMLVLYLFLRAVRPTLIVALSIPALFAGAPLTETVFGWPGVGRLLVEAVLAADFAVAQGIIIFLAALVIVFNLLADIAYALLDPRIRYD